MATASPTYDEPLHMVIIDLLAVTDGLRSSEILYALDIIVRPIGSKSRAKKVIRKDLLESEKLGLVYRTGQTRGTRWWLG